MLNGAGWVEQAVAARVRAAWIKFRELGGILCTRDGNFREGEEVWLKWYRILCAKCAEVEGERQLMSFPFEMSS